MYDISICIVTYNNSKIIKNTLTSLINYIDSKIKYIVYIVDNNSEDNTLEVVKEIKGNIKIIKNKKNIGFGAAHNKVINIVDSKYHCVVNPDITLENNVLYEMYEYMENHNDIGLLTPLIKFPNGEIQYLCKRNPTFLDMFLRLFFPNRFKKRQDHYVMKETSYDKEFLVEYATGCFMLFRTDIFKSIHGFDEKIFMYLEDADITRRVNEISKTIFYPYNYVIHAWERGSHNNFRLMLITIKSAFYYIKKWKTN